MIRNAIRYTIAAAIVGSFYASPPAKGQVGPDIITSDLANLQQSGREGAIGSGTVGLAMDMTACNLGDQPVEWFELPDTNHPLLSQNLYRLKLVDGSERFEQIGQSWIKHGHGAAQQPDCGTSCQPFPDNTQLGVGCGDTYLASQQANPCALGPRSLVNPYSGAMPAGADLGPDGNCSELLTNYPARNHIGHTHDGISHRLQVLDVDLMAALNPGARYFAEAQYLVPHEFVAGNGNQHNNASYREYLVLDPFSTGSFFFGEIGATISEAPAVDAWAGATQSIIEPAPLVDGRAILAHRVTDLGSGLWHYEFAVYNMNLDRSIGSLRIPLPTGVTVSGVGFHAPLNHAAELHADNYSNDPWEVTITADAITWSTTSFAADPLANAVRFGTLYNFRFDANAPPQAVQATVEMFKTVESLAVTAEGPLAPGPLDCNNNGIDDRCDLDCDAPGCSVPGCGLSSDCTANGIPDECEPDCDNDGLADRCEFASGAATDCNTNNVPDTCDPGGLIDCNGNTLPDFCDLLFGTSRDTNNNGVPDECEASDRTWYVDGDHCPGPGSGAITNPFCTIQTGIDASVSGDTVIVMDGVYPGPGTGELDFGGRSITLRSRNGPANCTLDTVTVLFVTGETSDARLEGFTLRDGEPGVRCSFSEPTISGCVFRMSSVDIHTESSSPTITDCEFRFANHGIEGDAASALRISGCRFVNNTRGIILDNDSGASIDRCTFESCSIGLFCSNSGFGVPVVTLSNSLFFGSVLHGIRPSGCGVFISNTTITGSGRQGLFGGTWTLLRNCIVWNNASGPFRLDFLPGPVEFSNIEGGWPGTGNIDVDPLFVNPASGDFHLSPDSPSIGAGDPTFVDTGVLDIDGEPRVAGGRVDMGPDEYHDCNANLVPDYQDILADASADCDGNAILDECEDTSADCNGNGVWDPCDIADETSADCQANGVPDGCDIALGISPDCTSNGIPDECEPDCNNNRIADTCDVSQLGVEDCDGNLVPDECEVEVGTGLDCNANLVPDDCDVTLGTSPDLNESGFPDECEVVPPATASPPHDPRKNRFLSIGASNPTIQVTMRVQLLDLACSSTGKKCGTSSDCTACVGGGNSGLGCSTASDCPGGSCTLSGESCEEQSPPVMLGWVGDPVQAGGDALPGTITSEVVKTQPAARTWTESVVHISDCDIAPAATYAISATVDGVLFSDPLIIGTIEKPQGKFWADIVGGFDGVEWSEPNNLVNVSDVTAMIAFITDKPGKPHITRVDLAGGSPTYTNFIVNATDLQLVIKGFLGDTYPPPAFVADGYPADGDVTQCP